MANKPILHRRDHEHGGPDTVRIHYESVGEPGTGGGIMFDTDNEGGYLSITTNDIDTDGAGYGMELFDDSGGGILTEAAAGGPILIKTIGAGGVSIQSGSTDAGLDILEESSTTGHGIQITSTASDIRLTPGGEEGFGISGYLVFSHLPTSDPGVVGAVWNNGGALYISAG